MQFVRASWKRFMLMSQPGLDLNPLLMRSRNFTADALRQAPLGQERTATTTITKKNNCIAQLDCCDPDESLLTGAAEEQLGGRSGYILSRVLHRIGIVLCQSSYQLGVRLVLFYRSNFFLL